MSWSAAKIDNVSPAFEDELEPYSTGTVTDYQDWLSEEDEPGFYAEPASCPACITGYGIPLGQLGRLVWYRCRQCGIDFSTEAAR